MELIEDPLIAKATLFILSFAGIFLIAIIYTRTIFSLNEKWRREIRALYQDLLALYVTKDEEQAEKIFVKIKRLSLSNDRKEILLGEVVGLYNNFTGICSERPKNLYNRMQLYDLSLHKLKDSRWHIKIEGIVEASLMGYREAYPLIFNLLRDTNINVRRHAKVGIVELMKKDGLKDLLDLPDPMSKWTHISILSILRRHPFKMKQAELDFLQNHSNPYIKRIAVHLERYSVAY